MGKLQFTVRCLQPVLVTDGEVTKKTGKLSILTRRDLGKTSPEKLDGSREHLPLFNNMNIKPRRIKTIVFAYETEVGNKK